MQAVLKTDFQLGYLKFAVDVLQKTLYSAELIISPCLCLFFYILNSSTRPKL